MQNHLQTMLWEKDMLVPRRVSIQSVSAKTYQPNLETKDVDPRPLLLIYTDLIRNKEWFNKWFKLFLSQS